jgi:hypothetical protein
MPAKNSIQQIKTRKMFLKNQTLSQDLAELLCTKEPIRFEFYAPFMLLQHMTTASNSDWSVKKIWFVGVLHTYRNTH